MRIEIGFDVGFDETGKLITFRERDKRLEMVLTEAARKFGRCNILSGQSAWINVAGSLVVGETRTLVIETSSDLEQERKARWLAEFVGQVFWRESIAFNVARSAYEMARDA